MITLQTPILPARIASDVCVLQQVAQSLVESVSEASCRKSTRKKWCKCLHNFSSVTCGTLFMSVRLKWRSVGWSARAHRFTEANAHQPPQISFCHDIKDVRPYLCRDLCLHARKFLKCREGRGESRACATKRRKWKMLLPETSKICSQSMTSLVLRVPCRSLVSVLQLQSQLPYIDYKLCLGQKSPWTLVTLIMGRVYRVSIGACPPPLRRPKTEVLTPGSKSFVAYSLL